VSTSRRVGVSRWTVHPAQVEGRRLSETVSEALLEEISGGLHAPGDRLPPEREIALRFGVSRTVVREAMRGLASRGVVTVRQGAGIFVAQAHVSATTDSIRLLVRGVPGMNYSRVYEVREVIEVTVARLAATRADAGGIDRLRVAATRLTTAVTGEEYAFADAEFHVVLAGLTDNPLLGALAEAIGDTMLDVRRQAAYLPGAHERIVDDHSQIVDAVAAGDADRAAGAMQRHLAHSLEIVRELDERLEDTPSGRPRV
jgi:DNA-binding FadR family transcriptional regulator